MIQFIKYLIELEIKRIIILLRKELYLAIIYFEQENILYS